MTGTPRGLLYHAKQVFCIMQNNTLFKTITGTAGGLLYHTK